MLWIGALGALVGWVLADFGTGGLVLGLFAGLFIGWAIARDIRAQIIRATQPLQDQIDALSATVRNGTTATVTAASAQADPPARIAARASERAATETAPAPVARENVQPADAPPPAPGIGAIAVTFAKGWLLGGNTIVRVGIVILFVGLSFLASYAASAGLFPIELRLALIVLIGVAILGFGFKTRLSRPAFGLTLQGAGIAAIYLTLFAAARLFDTFPVLGAFLIMIAVCALGCALALLQRSQALAVAAFGGGFAVPILLSDGGGNIAGVFVYYTVLNGAIAFIAQRQSWRLLYLIGFFATFGVAGLWEASAYLPGDYWVAQIYLVVSMTLYVLTGISATRAAPGPLGNVVDTTLLFGPAVAGFAVQVGLVHDRPFGSAFAALGFAMLYLGVAAWAMRTRERDMRVMNETMLAIGIAFVTLAVPLALGARWTSAAWVLEGAGAFWVGTRQARWLPRMFGLGLQLVAAILYLTGLQDNASAIPFGNSAFVGASLIAAAILMTAWWIRDAATVQAGATRSLIETRYAHFEAKLDRPVFLIGFAFCWLAWVVEIWRVMPSAYAGMRGEPVFAPITQMLLAMLAFVVSAWVAQMAARRLDWPVARWPSQVTLAALVVGFFSAVGMGAHVLETPGWAIWMFAVALHGWMLRTNDAETPADGWFAVLQASHVGGLWLATGMLADSLALGIDRARLWHTAWAHVVLLIAAIAILCALTVWTRPVLAGRVKAPRWPLDRHGLAYGWYGAAPIATLIFGGALIAALTSPGIAVPLPYIPFLNPLEIALGLALAVLALWHRTTLRIDPQVAGAGAMRKPWPKAAWAGLAFVVINTIWLRIAHHFLAVRWDADALLSSFVVQTGLAILWTMMALAMMVVAHRRGRRSVWLAGAGLLGVTVAKLVLVDMTNADGGARIVAFIGVGVLMLAVGYLAPLPPRGDAKPDGAVRDDGGLMA